jgi:L-iditol 2-dehydrogenase
MCFRLPEKVDYCEGALIEPLSVGFHAAQQGGAKSGQIAMVVGCGCIGIVTMLALKSMGISRVYMSDVIDVRIKKAESMGAEAVFNPMKEDVNEALKKATGGKGADLVIETAGNLKAQAQCVDLVKTGGTIVYVGMAAQAVTPIDINQVINKEATIKSVFRYRNLYPVALSAVEGGLPLKKVVSNSFDFKDTDKAFEYNINNKSDVTKIVIEY